MKREPSKTPPWRRPRTVARATPGERRSYVLATIIFTVAFIGLGWLIVIQSAHAATSGSAATALRVCAEPNDLPYSNKNRDGFENKLAARIGKGLGKPVQYVWREGAGLRRGLGAQACDVIMGWPTKAQRTVMTTEPYYRSTYVLVYRASAPYTIHSLKSPILKTLKVGVREIGDQWTGLPGGAMLAQHDLQGSARPYRLRGAGQHASPSADLIDAVADGDVDAAILWGPPAGYLARRQPIKLVVVPLTRTHARVPTQFSISMAVRKGDTALRTKLGRFVAQHREMIRALLESYNVPLLPLGGARNSSPSAAEQ